MKNDFVGTFTNCSARYCILCVNERNKYKYPCLVSPCTYSFLFIQCLLFKKIRVSAPDCTAVSVNKNVFSEKGKIIGRRRREREHGKQYRERKMMTKKEKEEIG